ncbi:MAG: complex I NDUFA9 subunit family protein [Gammaproteobacteria bacterium]|nr:complex I NDUFA9 subunit family protein [Gammaproteobacteria bacterium]
MRIGILGGTGFVGRALSAHLVAAGHEVLVPTTHHERHRDLTVLPTLALAEGDVHDPEFLRRCCEGRDAVINLVGILNEKGRSGQGFARAHVELPEKLVAACRAAGVKRLLHMSALNASLNAPSHYLRTKAMGEDTVHRAAADGLRVTSFRPSVIFGPRDSFVNRFAGLLKFVPGVFPLACPDAKFQPVYVEDVVSAFVYALRNTGTHGQRYDLCGPKVYTLREIVSYIAEVMGKRVTIIGLNHTLSHMQAAFMEFAPGKPFSLDNFRSLQVNSVCSGRAFPEVFGITPMAMEQVVPGYIGHK